MDGSIKITFLPDGKAIYGLPGTTILEAAARAGIVVETPCGGKGTCGRCKVLVSEGAPEPTAAEVDALSAEEIQQGWRLSCQAKLERDARVEIPDAARFLEQQILSTGVGGDTPLHPNIQKVVVDIPAASIENPQADADRFLAQLGDQVKDRQLSVRQLRDLSDALGHSSQVTAVIEDDWVLAIEPEGAGNTSYGIAFDIGTTTLVAVLFDLASGHQVALASATNPQGKHGEDVISRITFAEADPQGIQTLQAEVVESLNALVDVACQEAGVRRDRIYEAIAAGNTTMNHLLLGVDPSRIARAPFAAVIREAVVTRAMDLGLEIHPRASIRTLPNIAGFVGGDTVGVILASGLRHSDALQMAIDIGTNGEIVAGTKDRLIACSTAAGPAFEGARIRFGMRAAKGAIEKVLFDGEVQINVIGHAPPRGICGSGLLDVVGEMVRVGIIGSNGSLRSADELPDLPDALRRRIVAGENGNDFILIDQADTSNDEAIRITQRDVREMQLAKGAIRAGLEVVLRELGVEANDLQHILLAGGFGNFIRRSQAKRVGLLPDVPSEKILFIGNAACTGARMALLSRDCREEADRISRETEFLELGGRPEFQIQFAEAMMFPEGAE